MHDMLQSPANIDIISPEFQQRSIGHICGRLFSLLNYVLMQQGAKRLISVTDFKSFCKTGSDVTHYQCSIRECAWTFTKDVLIFEITANRFLHGMVRAIVGTHIEMGRGKLRLDEFEQILKAGDRITVPFSAPAHGLVLEEVVYK